VEVGRRVEFVARCFAGCTFEDILAHVERREAPIAIPTPEPESLPSAITLEAYEAALTPDVAKAVEGARGWTHGTMQAFGIGYHSRSLTIPMYERGELVNVGRYRPGSGKVIGLRGRRKPLYHASVLGALPNVPLWIVEGEPDVLSAFQLGVWAVGVPGVNNWRYEAAQRFQRRRVRICMDCDRPGREAAYRIFMDLAGVAADVKVIDLYPERDDGYDLTDLLRENDLAEARAYVRWLTEH
jgi:hypothetical protein